VTKWLSYVYIGAGWLSLTVGAIGIFLPVLPTTPFAILAAFFFSKGSPRLHRWLLDSRMGPYIRDWRDRRVIPLRAKLTASLLLAASLAFSLVRIPERLWPLKIFVAVSVSCAAVFIWRQRSR
jgi:uncharacterized membrane protein YbaN (DUF454 family)